jgi:hypothetical protein
VKRKIRELDAARDATFPPSEEMTAL